jgi:hypothetical protein
MPLRSKPFKPSFIMFLRDLGGSQNQVGFRFWEKEKKRYFNFGI